MSARESHFSLDLLGFSKEEEKLVRDVIKRIPEIKELHFEELGELSEFDPKIDTGEIVILNSMGHLTDVENKIRKIKNKNPEAQIILVVHNQNFHLALKAIRNGVRDIIEFPFEKPDLRESIKKAVSFLLANERSESFREITTLLNNFSDARRFKEESEVFSAIEKFFANRNLGEKVIWGEGKPQTNFNTEIIRLMKDDQTWRVIEKDDCKEVLHHWGESSWANYTFQKNETETRLNYFMQLIGNALEHTNYIKQNEKLTSLAHSDDVTGLYNQRKLYKDLDTAVENFEKDQQPFSILFIDVDHFKQVNDGHGHIVGSLLLSQIARELEKVLRETDLIYRYGGDEFVILLPETEKSSAKEVGNRILQHLAKKRFTRGSDDEIQISVSIGVAEFPTDTKDKEEVLQAADDMMYMAKKSGRGCVFVIGQEEEDQAC